MKNKYTAVFIDYLTITMGVCLYAITLAFCVLPYKLTSGGVAGIGTLVFYATGFEVQNTYIIINVALLGAAIIELGWRFCIKTIYATFSLTFAIWAAQRIFEMVDKPLLFGDELFMACIISAIGTGSGLALCFLAGGSTGGTDIIAAIVNKYRNMSIGKVIMIVDIAIISSCYFVFHDIQRVVFGYVLLVLATGTIDYWLGRNNQSVEFKIFSRNPNQIAETLVRNGMGVTILNGEGFYTRSERRVIISVVNRRERLLVFRMIKSIDPFAFVTMGNVSGVWGEGFDNMKDKESKANAHIMVMLTDDKQEMENVNHQLGSGFQLRSIREIGCDMDYPINKDILSPDYVVRTRFVKYYYGYDCIAVDPNADPQAGILPIILVTGKAATDHPTIQRFATFEDLKKFLLKNKG